ncbi:MAG: UDP-N-acetylmuramoyl-tripeptide--D-alanyl-D-alanine ligase [Alphaproteobacteria bacterium]|nr:UDP-N-acetylmuramoyl-tripeptide--D-alanyl-D-alanine ligase [Alphaproteobacteria bacterium]MCW5742301.1 UDP-N-acetylmuramoyl-tripeptide--D-alanyl-D-alanine ligase [Alphaproteobacteria bacterium]
MSVGFVKLPLWSVADAQSATGGVALGPAWLASGIAIDTRMLERGDLFVALRGERDGHAFVPAAFERGAAAALVDDPRMTVEGAGGPLLRVADSLKGLAAMGFAARARSSARAIAITGSVGKTSTKDALRHVLSRQGATHAAAASFNNHIGVPLTLARLPVDARFGIFEVGTNHPGEIEPLARLVHADVAVITTVQPVHIEHFGTIDAIVREKGQIFAGANGGTAILERDSPHFDALATIARGHGIRRIISFGEDAAADVRLTACGTDANGSDVAALVLGGELRYRVGAPGLHWARNSLAVLAAVEALGADVPAAAAALSGVSPPAGRGARRRVALGGGDIELIDESYNASPIAVRAMLTNLAMATPGPGGRRVLVLGDMLELGAAAEAAHVGLAPDIGAAGVSQVYTCGPNMEKLRAALPAPLRAVHAADSARLAQRVVEGLRAGDVVAVKGSLGSKMKVVVDAILAMGAVTGGSGKG